MFSRLSCAADKLGMKFIKASGFELSPRVFAQVAARTEWSAHLLSKIRDQAMPSSRNFIDYLTRTKGETCFINYSMNILYALGPAIHAQLYNGS